MTRDEELDALAKELAGEEKRVDVGGLCFLDRNRVCGPDCVAFVDPAAPTAAERCAVLINAAAVTTALIQIKRVVTAPRAPTPPGIYTMK